MKSNIKQIKNRMAILGFGLLTTSFGFTPTVKAQIPSPSVSTFEKPELTNPSKYSLDAIMDMIPSILINFGMLLLFGSLIAAGVFYMASFGNEENTVKAKNALYAAAVGAILLAIGSVLSSYIINTLGV